jgi:hypothetical protein
MEAPKHIDRAARIAASRRAQAKVELFRHLFMYVVVIGALFIINEATTPDTLWFLWPATGWGVGLLAHAFNVFVFSDKLVRRMTQRELQRDKSS